MTVRCIRDIFILILTSRSQAKATIGFTYDNSKSVGDSDKDDDDDDSSDSDSDSILSDIGKWTADINRFYVVEYIYMYHSSENIISDSNDSLMLATTLFSLTNKSNM